MGILRAFADLCAVSPERQDRGQDVEQGTVSSSREYFNTFGMTRARLAHARPDVIIMHPGPMNRGVEIASDVADGPYSVILEQVANGVAVRMAVLYLLAGGAEGD